MALDKLVDSALLDAAMSYEAGKIRTKLGSSAQINYDLANGKGFGDAIDAIPTGGGGDYVATDWLDLSKPTGEIVSDIAFADSSAGGFVLYGRKNITKYVDLLSTGFPQQFFNSCSGMEYLVVPNAVLSRSSIALGCSSLVGADILGSLGSSQQFRGCTKLKHLVLRSNSQRGLTNINSFSDTPFASYGAGGTLYVPADLVSSYQSATNWSTILGYPNNQIKSIESTATDPDAPVDLTTHYIDGTPIPTT